MPNALKLSQIYNTSPFKSSHRTISLKKLVEISRKGTNIESSRLDSDCIKTVFSQNGAVNISKWQPKRINILSKNGE